MKVILPMATTFLNFAYFNFSSVNILLIFEEELSKFTYIMEYVYSHYYLFRSHKVPSKNMWANFMFDAGSIFFRNFFRGSAWELEPTSELESVEASWSKHSSPSYTTSSWSSYTILHRLNIWSWEVACFQVNCLSQHIYLFCFLFIFICGTSCLNDSVK